MGRCRVDLDSGIAHDIHGGDLLTDIERHIDSEGRIGIYDQVASVLRSETGCSDGEIVVADREIWECVEPLLVGDGLIGGLSGDINQFQRLLSATVPEMLPPVAPHEDTDKSRKNTITRPRILDFATENVFTEFLRN